MASITQSFPSVSHDFVEKEFKSVKEMKISKREAIKQAKIAEREAVKQAKIAEREAVKQAKIADKEAVKHANIAEREAVKQAKIADNEAVKQSVKNRRERVKDIKRLYKFQVTQTNKLLRKYRRDEEERIILENIYRQVRANEQQEAAARERRLSQLRQEQRVRQSRAEERAEERYIAARLHSMNVAGGIISIPDRQPTGQLPERLARGVHEPRSPINPPTEVYYRPVNPTQELINKDKIDCNKKQENLVCVDNAFEMSDCPVCFDELGNTNKMVLRCGHTVCGDCITNHMQRVGGLKCPVCRVQYGVRVKGWQPPKK